MGRKLLDRIAWWEGYTARNDAEMNNNPSPGNKAGGLTTILEKSLGAVAKAGTTPLNEVVGYGEQVKGPGLVFMDTVKAICAMILAGPFMCGFTQTINDWFDRELDAINEPYRPIPSGAISELEVYSQIAFLLVGSIVVALQLDGWAGNDWPVITAIAAFGSFVAYIYSAPPLKLKANGWTGTYALGSSYIALPWWCGQCMFNVDSFNERLQEYASQLQQQKDQQHRANLGKGHVPHPRPDTCAIEDRCLI